MSKIQWEPDIIKIRQKGLFFWYWSVYRHDDGSLIDKGDAMSKWAALRKAKRRRRGTIT